VNDDRDDAFAEMQRDDRDPDGSAVISARWMKRERRIGNAVNGERGCGYGWQMTRTTTLPRFAGHLIVGSLLIAAPAIADEPAPDPAPNVSIVGRDDPDLAASIYGAIEIDLGRPITRIAAGDPCSAPCVLVAIDDASATVRVTPLAGELRERTIAIANRSDLIVSELVALLVGNLVRDEAGEVVAGLDPAGPVTAPSQVDSGDPAPTPMPDESATTPEPDLATPSAAPVIAGATVEGEAIYGGGVSIGLVPFVGVSVGGGARAVSISALVGVSSSVRAFAVSGIADVVRGDVHGMQVGGIAAVSRRVFGVQVGGVAAVAGGGAGVQIAGVATAANGSVGTQIAGVAAAARGAVGSQFAGVAGVAGSAGIQAAGVAVASRGKVGTQIAGVAVHADSGAGAQIAGVAASSRGKVGVQIAGVANVASGAGVQIAGVVNASRGGVGAQIGVVNVAREVHGFQIGLINVARRSEGSSFGLINVVPGGRTAVEATVDSASNGAVLLRHGGRRWHNVYGVGGHVAGDADDIAIAEDGAWMYGLGMGPNFRLGTVLVDVDAMAWHVHYGEPSARELDLLAQLRLTLGIPVGPVQLLVGGSAGAYITTDEARPRFGARMTSPTTMMPAGDDVRLVFEPSLFVGLRL
jgi:hypothetical protein